MENIVIDLAAALDDAMREPILSLDEIERLAAEDRKRYGVKGVTLYTSVDSPELYHLNGQHYVSQAHMFTALAKALNTDPGYIEVQKQNLFLGEENVGKFSIDADSL